MESGIAVSKSGNLPLENASPQIRRHVLAGTLAGIGLLGLYFGILILAQGLEHSLEQTARLWYWVMLLVIGFSIQTGLFSFVRHEMRQRRAVARASVASCGGISGGAMVVCCAHHLSDVLPLLGIAGLSSFLAGYQVFFMLVGVLANAVGITIMLRIIQYHRLCPAVSKWKVDMSRVRNATIAVAVLTLVATVLLQPF